MPRCDFSPRRRRIRKTKQVDDDRMIIIMIIFFFFFFALCAFGHDSIEERRNEGKKLGKHESSSIIENKTMKQRERN